MTQIVDLILNRLVEHLSTEMRKGFVTGEPEYVEVVKKGLLQSEKIKKNIQIGITGGDHEDPNYRDGIVTLEELPNIGMNIPVREVGGGQMWWRRGIARLECFFVAGKALDENNAHLYAYDILGRLEANIENAVVYDLTDDFGESAHMIFCFGNTYFESGGPPKNYIFRGKVFWQVLTERM